MYPILETERLLLVPLQENDFDYMFKLNSNPFVIKTMEGNIQSNPNAYKNKFLEEVKSGEFLTIWHKEAKYFIGYIAIHQYIKHNKINYSQMWTAILPEYWNCGFCTEATKKLLNFAFLGIKTPWICANQFHTNPAAGKVLKQCGLSYYTTYKMNNRPYDQYRYLREDYFKNNNITMEAENPYNYTFAIRLSPYSFDKPIRVINSITYIKQPTGYLCGQAVIAMLANVSIDEVIDIMQNNKGTSTDMIREALKWFGIKTATRARQRYIKDTALPECCILSLQLPGYGHWSLFYKGKFYDPEFGLLDKPPEKAKLCYYWEVVC